MLSFVSLLLSFLMLSTVENKKKASRGTICKSVGLSLFPKHFIVKKKKEAVVIKCKSDRATVAKSNAIGGWDNSNQK